MGKKDVKNSPCLPIWPGKRGLFRRETGLLTRYGAARPGRREESTHPMEYKQIPSIARVPLSEQVYNVLMDSIVSGSLEAGTELREQHVAKQMGVSATPVREAFKRLASDGLIEIVPYRGAVVKTLDPQEIREAYACREALEHLVVKEVMERLTPEDVQTLYQMLEGFRQAKGVEDISQASQAFDDYLYHLTGNRTLQNLLAVLKGVISRDRKYSAGSPERQKAIYQEHRAIVEALERRDLEGARQAVSRHIHNGQKYIEEKR